ncbi:hypothetical protein MNBD_GAMMA12-2000 [hydrothermal vent metagenome]|uniref:Uncharacterized protein n=1 Tax=hydrothermal vent metagenome TaxID=652676 RepID=A0A3B0YLL1_9ZZZZ
MSKELNSCYLKKVILESFQDLEKGNGIGVRECAALDDYADDHELIQARALDVESNWWEYPDDCRDNYFDYALTYNCRDGILFHLPALMTAVIDGYGNIIDVSLYGYLCEGVAQNPQNIPHHGHRGYVNYLQSINVYKIIAYFKFNSQQIHAISLYLLWEMQNDSYHFFENREKWIAFNLKMHNIYKTHASDGNYTLTIEDVIAIVDENHRIVRDWFSAAKLDLKEWSVDKK